MNVLFVTHYSSLYGANFSMIQLILELREKGVNATVMMPVDDVVTGQPLWEKLDTLGIPYVRTKVKTIKSDSWKKVVPKLFYAHALFQKVYKSIDGKNFDLVHSNGSVIDVGRYIAREKGVPHIWHLREFGDLDYNLMTPFGRWFQKIIYHGGNTFVAISNKILDHYKKYLGGQDIRVIYNGVKPLPMRQPSDDGIVRFCIVGMMQESKRQLDVAKAAAELRQRGHVDFHVSIIGDGVASYEQTVANYIDDNDLSLYVTMTGRQENVPESLTKMDVGITASSHEAFGRVTVEYMMAGLAVIASDGGASTEIVDDENTGLIYESGNVGQLTDRMQLLIENPEKREQLAQESHRHAMNNFQSKANSEAIYSLYCELLGKRV